MAKVMTIDDQSPPGSWESEMQRMPWRFNEPMRYSQQLMVEGALASVRKAGLNHEADILALEIKTLKNEVADLRK